MALLSFHTTWSSGLWNSVGGSINRSSVAALECRKAVEMSPALTFQALTSDIVNSSLSTQKMGVEA